MPLFYGILAFNTAYPSVSVDSSNQVSTVVRPVGGPTRPFK